jgi:hypothetical protein
MAELTDAQIAAANERGRAMRDTLPHAAAARYDAAADRIVIDLTNGTTFAFPPRLAQGLEHGSADELGDMELSGGGYGIHWPRLDADLTVPGLLNGVFGTAKWMAALAGTAKSPAKAAAARRNGAKGGRPRKAAA